MEREKGWIDVGQWTFCNVFIHFKLKGYNNGRNKEIYKHLTIGLVYVFNAIACSKIIHYYYESNIETPFSS